MRYRGKRSVAGPALAVLAALALVLVRGVAAEDTEEVTTAKAQEWKSIDTQPLYSGIHHAVMKFKGQKAPYAQYPPAQIIHIAETLLAYQNGDGGWPENIDWIRVFSEEELAALPHGQEGKQEKKSTLDNDNTWSQIGYLAQVYRQARLKRYADAALKGIDYLLREQRPSGGWRGWDVEAITFNDNVMVGTLKTLKAAAEDRDLYGFVDEERRANAKKACEKGIRCILDCQIKCGGRLTAWCEQHDHDTLAPIWARTFEPPSITPDESVGVVRLLMDIPNPSAEIRTAIQSAVAWFEKVKIAGLRIDKVPAEPTAFPRHYSDSDSVEVKDAGAPPIWARYYDLETETPIFCNRERKITRKYEEVDRERRTGMPWYGYWPARLLEKDYPAWCAKWAAAPPSTPASGKAVVLSDDFSAYSTGIWLGAVGAEAEYHYLPQTAPVGNWCVSTYRSEPDSQRAWRIEEWDGQRVLATEFENKGTDTHPMVVAGDARWRDYTTEVAWTPLVDKGQSGLLFRYQNDRCYYFLGVVTGKAILKYVNDGDGFRKPHEETLAEQPLSWKTNDQLTALVEVTGSRIHASVAGVVLDATHDAFAQGRIALMADAPCRFNKVAVSMPPDAKAAFDKTVQEEDVALRALQAKNPKPVVWKKVRTAGFGVGRNLRFGDLDGDGQPDVLVCQPVHHGPKDTRSEVSCLTAITFDGKALWQIGEPDPWKNRLTSDVAFQIHDLDGDGRNEVIYCKDFELVVAEGTTGKTIRKIPTPEMPANTKAPYNQSPRIFGDSLFVCDLRGQGHAGDIVLKDRYQSFWVYDEHLALQWKAQCNTGHYPCAADTDHDGKDELAAGYSLFDHDGKLLWSLDDQLGDHDDGVAMVPLTQEKDAEPVFVCAASDEGMLFVDMKGKILKHLYLGHVQNPGIADFRPDLPGLEVATVNFWGNQGIIHFYDAHGNVYHDFEPFQHGSLCQPVNWTGAEGEYVLLSANVEDGGLFDGWGRRVVKLPADGHPDMCCAALNLTGDCRDEIIVWDPYELWVYTQDNNPRPGRLYQPVRSPLYNDSNYRAIVSIPGWSDAAASEK